MSLADEEAKASVLHANETFYEAFRNCNYEVMDELWSRAREVTVVHPGWPGLMGREDVLES